SDLEPRPGSIGAMAQFGGAASRGSCRWLVAYLPEFASGSRKEHKSSEPRPHAVARYKKGENMKSRFVVFTSLGLLAVLTFPACRVVQAQGTKRAQYSVRDLGTLGGVNSFAYAINRSGMVAGGANTPGQNDFIAQTAFLWYGGQPISLSTLPGP